MANAINKTVMQNGVKSFLVHFSFESDGVEGELKNYVLVDPAVDYEFMEEGKLRSLVRPVISQIWYSQAWYDSVLYFDSLVPVHSWTLSRDGSGYYDFRYFGGISDRYTPPQDQFGSDRTGKILLTTNGFAPLGSMGCLVLELRKN